MYEEELDRETLDEIASYGSCQGCSRGKKMKNRDLSKEDHLLGTDKNELGRVMGQICYFLEKGHFPSDTERREFHKKVTRGDSISIEGYYTRTISHHLNADEIDNNPFHLFEKIKRDPDTYTTN